MTIKSNLALLKEQHIEIQGYLSDRLKARHLEWIVEHLDDPVAAELFQIIIQERNDRAKVNSTQSLQISRHQGKIEQLGKSNQNLSKENVELKQEVSYWQEKVNELLRKLEQLRQDLLDFDQSEIYRLGQWLKASLSKTGQERQQALLEKELVHKDSYNLAVSDLKNIIQEQQDGITQIKDRAISTVESLEKTNDSSLFHGLSLEQQRQARKKGYYNSGWGKVKSSWELLQDFKNNTYKVVSLFEHELNKGNLVKAMDLAIIESEKAKKMSEEGKQELEKISNNLHEIADKALAKYPLL
jgi:FtsZ-binding cell division protein ZapB